MYSNFKRGDVVELKRPEGVLKGRTGVIVGEWTPWTPPGEPKDNSQPLVDWVHGDWPGSEKWDSVMTKIMTRGPHFTKHLVLLKRGK